MPRMARIVIPGYPHHVTQRGNRRQRTFFEAADYLAYLELLRTTSTEAGVEIWAYCLMPNHVHLVAVPQEEQGLARMLGVTHHRYARRVNAAHGWRGHLWQERFHSFVMDETHLLAAVRYIELNPVRAGLCRKVDNWRWSSVHAHLRGKPDGIVTTAPMCKIITDWRHYLSLDNSPEMVETLRKHTKTGRPAGNNNFIKTLESLSGRRLRQLRPGPKPKS